MRYLSTTVPTYVCDDCGDQMTHGEVLWDGYDEGTCRRCQSLVSGAGDRDATYWSVGVYEVTRQYGGPEEGGWYYDAGYRIEPHKMRVFADYAEAALYAARLWDELPESDKRGESRLTVCGFTECLPETHWPRARPRYC